MKVIRNKKINTIKQAKKRGTIIRTMMKSGIHILYRTGTVAKGIIS